MESIKSGRKWKPQEAVRMAEEHLKHQEIVGHVCQGRLEVGHYHVKQWWNGLNSRGKTELVAHRVTEAEEEGRRVKAIGLAIQGNWTKWEGAFDRQLSWREQWTTGQSKLAFLICTVVDLLPTPSNLRSGAKKMKQPAICAEQRPVL